MDDITPIRKLQLEELKILDEFVRICDENNLRYYSLGGTLLGSIRHKGFIPWDDDVDIAMPRNDYELLLEKYKEKISNDFDIITHKNDPNYRYPWARMISKKMKIINHMANIPREEFAWIDIIPLDGFPNKGMKRSLHKIHLSFWWDLNQIVQFDELVDQKRKRSFIGRTLIKIASLFKWIGKIVNYKTCLDHLNKVLMKYPYETDTDEVINFLAAFGFDEVFTRKSLGAGRNYEFEQRQIKGPDDYDSVLKRIYNDDYMTLPRAEDRNKHQSEIIESNIG